MSQLQRSSLRDVPDYSMWGDKFKMKAFRSDPARWNKDWEKALRQRRASDVFTRMGGIYASIKDSEESIIPVLTKQMVGVQEALVKLWASVGKLGGHFITAFLLLEEKERARHLNKGFEDSYARVAGRQDARCLAPEIQISAFLKRSGQGFLEFMELFVKGKKDVGRGKPYLHRSEWWDKALDGVPKPKLGDDTYEVLTLHRNDFITKYLLHSGLSIFHDLTRGSVGMKPFVDLIADDPSAAESLAFASSGIRDKPVVRCQNCTKTQDSDGPKFMYCGSCKSKLDFPMHYCSIQCQRQDWPNHKKSCGKEKVMKKLAGTIHDPYWFQSSMPDSMRHIPVSHNGGVEILNLGFGDPANTPSYSPALQRQVNLLTLDRDADYFLFDQWDRPVRFAINHDYLLKMGFRAVRTEVLSSTTPKGVETLVEFILSVMGPNPGLTRQGIIAQFAKEYRRDVARKLANQERVQKSLGRGTLLESMNRGISTFVPRYY